MKEWRRRMHKLNKTDKTMPPKRPELTRLSISGTKDDQNEYEGGVEVSEYLSPLYHSK